MTNPRDRSAVGENGCETPPPAVSQGACGRCGDALARYLLHPVLDPGRDTAEQLLRKKATVTFLWASIAAMVGSNSVTALDGFIPSIENYATVAATVYCCIAYAWLRRVRFVSDAFCYGLAAIACGLIMAHDLQSATRATSRGWALLVVVLDYGLVCNASRINWVVPLGLVWVTLTAAESSHRFGLYDLPGLAPQSKRIQICACATPPCPVADVPTNAGGSLLVFLLDFLITRSFATQLRQKRAELEESVDVAGRLAQHLAAYDLDAAEATLAAKAEKMPDDMAGVFRGLIANLRSYRPYLPDGLFNTDTDSSFDTDEGFQSDSSPSMSGSRYSEQQSVSGEHGNAEHSQSTTGLLPRVATGFARALQLDLKRISLVTVVLRDSIEVANVEDFLARHAHSLSLVYDVIKAERGSLDHFHGDRVYASFNAFGKAYTPGIKAANAAAEVIRLPHHRAAVVTGMAYTGLLGIDAVRKPTVVGALPQRLEFAVRAAAALAEAAVCCDETAAEAGQVLPLRALLHRVMLPVGYDDAMLYRVHAADTQNSLTHPKAHEAEWMYELAGNSAVTWTRYNAAAKLHYNSSYNAACAYLADAGENDVLQQFEADAALAKVVNMCLHTCGDGEGLVVASCAGSESPSLE
eukprot:TRINITY_DN3125_c0_g1_i10.p1 TRINITY_DN3125_c0_g1~~TRINITY_DN3125_c0_g1_i10.p1  ORF type:complete len:638 (+),score=103.93 TRINITY_DN3125_c0_g1_i10:52-1965(+)